MTKKISKLRPRAITPKGFRDYFGAEVVRRDAILRQVADIYFRYGFEPLESSAIETVDALGKFLPDTDQPNAGIFCWRENNDWLALRYDLTAPLARVYAQYQNHLPTPYRRYSMGPVWRNEKPGIGRYRQFYQCDADTVGSASMASDAEICAMLADALEGVGIPKGEYQVKLNNRKILNGVLACAGLSEQAQRDHVLRTIDKFDKVGVDGVMQLLTSGRLDESGAYIEGVGLRQSQAEAIIAFLTSGECNPDQILDELRTIIGTSEVGQEGIDELKKITELLDIQGYGPDQIRIDTTVVRGLGYYTGPVYEAELTFDITDERGRQRQFGSVAGGGRYDNLVQRFTGQRIPATGVSLGVDRLLTALDIKNRRNSDIDGPVLVTVMDRERMQDYQKMAVELRNNGVRAEVYLGNPKSFGNQLKYADRRNAPVAIIEGADEKLRGIIQIKDLVLGKEIAKTATVGEWRQRPAQFEVPRNELVNSVKKILEQGI